MRGCCGIGSICEWPSFDPAAVRVPPNIDEQRTVEIFEKV